MCAMQEAERLRKEEEERASKAAKEEAEKQRQQKDEVHIALGLHVVPLCCSTRRFHMHACVN